MARKKKKYHYIYKIICLKNERYYIGMHSTNNLEDGYMGGGKRIKNSVKKHGKDAHRKDILEFFESREDLKKREIQLVNEELINDPMCMNLQLGGGGGFINEEHKMKCSLAGNKRLIELISSNSDFRNDFIKKSTIGSIKGLEKIKKNNSEEYEKIKNAGRTSFIGKLHSEETKKKIGEINSLHQGGTNNSQYGKKWIYNMVEKKSIKIDESSIEYYISIGWILGRKLKF